MTEISHDFGQNGVCDRLAVSDDPVKVENQCAHCFNHRPTNMYQSPRDWPEIYRGVGRSCRRSPSTNIDSIGTARASQPWPSFLIAQLGPKARNKARKDLDLSRG